MSTPIRNLIQAIENDDVDLVGEYVKNSDGNLDINDEILWDDNDEDSEDDSEDDSDDDAQKTLVNLIQAIENEDVDLVREYLTHSDGELDINERIGWDERTPLHWAVEGNTGTAIMELLLENGADIEIEDAVGNTPLIDAAKRSECVEFIQCLLKHGAKVNHCDHTNWTALHCACHNGNIVAVRILLEHGADIHARDAGGRTPLQMAARECGKENATTNLNVLLDHGADILTCDNDGRTLLHTAIDGGRCYADHSFITEIISFLLDKKKIDLNGTNDDGNTVLHYCIIHIGSHAPDLCHELTRMLLAHGAKIHIQNQKRQTVFHLALKNKEIHETVRLLLAHLDLYGIDRHSMLSMTDDDGYTAIQYASSKEGAQSLLEQLTNNGEDVLPCCYDLFFAKDGGVETLTQELQADLDRFGQFYDSEMKSLLEYLHSFTENSLAVPESTEHDTSAIAVRINPLMNDFQQVLANQMLRMNLTCPAVSTNVMNELPESIKLVTMGYLAPADVMKRNIKMVKTGVHDNDENHDKDDSVAA